MDTFKDLFCFFKKHSVKYIGIAIIMLLCLTPFFFFYWSKTGNTLKESSLGYFTEKDEYPRNPSDVHTNYYKNLIVINAEEIYDNNGNAISHKVYSAYTGQFIYLQQLVPSIDSALNNSIEEWDQYSMEEKIRWIATRFSANLGPVTNAYTVKFSLLNGDPLDQQTAYKLLDLYTEFVKSTFLEVDNQLIFKESDAFKFTELSALESSDGASPEASIPIVLFIILGTMTTVVMTVFVFILHFVLNKKIVGGLSFIGSEASPTIVALEKSQVLDQMFIKMCENVVREENKIIAFASTLNCTNILSDIAKIFEKNYIKLTIVDGSGSLDIQTGTYVHIAHPQEQKISLLNFSDYLNGLGSQSDCVLLVLDGTSPIQMLYAQTINNYLIYEKYYVSHKSDVAQVLEGIADNKARNVLLILER